MVAAGEFPIATDLSDQTINPRVGDGFIRLDPDGNVEYASPNALSAYRRIGLIGDLVDENLAALTGTCAAHRRPGRRLGGVGAVGPGRPAGRARLRRRAPAAPGRCR